jgi:hypothetical protein
MSLRGPPITRLCHGTSTSLRALNSAAQRDEDLGLLASAVDLPQCELLSIDARECADVDRAVACEKFWVGTFGSDRCSAHWAEGMSNAALPKDV